jgi:hypothetical protein
MRRTKTRRKLRKITPALRRRIEKTVEQLIEALDSMDAPAEDLEDTADAEPSGDEDEPSLGAANLGELRSQENWAGPRQNAYAVDCEDEHDGSEPDVDDEPSLCGVTVEARGNDRDLEDDDEGEPSLGSSEGSVHNQTRWASGNRTDREEDGDEHEHSADAEPDGDEGEARDYCLTNRDMALRKALRRPAGVADIRRLGG